MTNALAALFVEASVERRNSQARRTTAFLRDALARTEKELREQSRLVTEFRQAHRGELPEEQETQPAPARAALRAAGFAVAADHGERRTACSRSPRAAASSSEADFVLTDLRRQLAREIAIHTDEHPNVIALRERLKRLAESDRNSPLPAAASHMVADERREIARMREQRAQIDAELAQINQRIDRIPRTAEQLAALQQKETVLREDYTASLRKVEQAELAENLEAAQQGGQVSILDSAVPPSSPKLSRWVVLLAGLALTAGLAIGSRRAARADRSGGDRPASGREAQRAADPRHGSVRGAELVREIRTQPCTQRGGRAHGQARPDLREPLQQGLPGPRSSPAAARRRDRGGSRPAPARRLPSPA